MWRKENPSALLVGMQIVATTVESNMDVSFDPVIPFLEIYLKKQKTLISKNISTFMFIAALFTITNIWKQPKCPSVDEWIKEMWTFTQWNTTWPLK